MKRIATHRVYDAEEGKIFSHQVVEVNEQGEVIRIYPLTGEVRQTEWWGGMIILYPALLPERLPDETFSHYGSRIVSSLKALKEKGEKKAYWLSSFNVSEMEFTPETHIILCR